MGGFVARDRWALLAVAVVTVLLLLVGPLLAGFPRTPVHQIAAAIAGVLSGYGMAGQVDRRGWTASSALNQPRRLIADAAP